ncbi:MAG: hypothetical protein WAU91_13350 [Desulfatitalea sp.]
MQARKPILRAYFKRLRRAWGALERKLSDEPNCVTLLPKTSILDEGRIKQFMKEAIVEALQEQRGLLRDKVWSARMKVHWTNNNMKPNDGRQHRK